MKIQIDPDTVVFVAFMSVNCSLQEFATNVIDYLSFRPKYIYRMCTTVERSKWFSDSLDFLNASTIPVNAKIGANERYVDISNLRARIFPLLCTTIRRNRNVVVNFVLHGAHSARLAWFSIYGADCPKCWRNLKAKIKVSVLPARNW